MRQKTGQEQGRSPWPGIIKASETQPLTLSDRLQVISFFHGLAMFENKVSRLRKTPHMLVVNSEICNALKPSTAGAAPLTHTNEYDGAVSPSGLPQDHLCLAGGEPKIHVSLALPFGILPYFTGEWSSRRRTMRPHSLLGLAALPCLLRRGLLLGYLDQDASATIQSSDIS